jgi:hypothetical protein
MEKLYSQLQIPLRTDLPTELLFEIKILLSHLEEIILTLSNHSSCMSPSFLTLPSLCSYSHQILSSFSGYLLLYYYQQWFRFLQSRQLIKKWIASHLMTVQSLPPVIKPIDMPVVIPIDTPPIVCTAASISSSKR